MSYINETVVVLIVKQKKARAHGEIWMENMTAEERASAVSG